MVGHGRTARPAAAPSPGRSLGAERALRARPNWTNCHRLLPGFCSHQGSCSATVLTTQHWTHWLRPCRCHGGESCSSTPAGCTGTQRKSRFPHSGFIAVWIGSIRFCGLAGVNYLVRPATTILAGGGGEFVDGLGVFGCLFLSSFLNGCSASEARQAGGICRGAVVKPRTPQGLSTGLACGQVACPRRAKFVQTLSIVVAARARFAGACAA